MKYRTTFLGTSIVAAGLLLGSIRAAAQEEPQQEQQDPRKAQDKPKPAGASTPILADYADQDNNGDQQPLTGLVPDTRPLTGVEVPTVGSQGMGHSYWVPGFQYDNLVRSTQAGNLTTPGWNTTSYFVGDLGLQQTWERAQLTVNYSGGGYVATHDQGNGVFQQLGLVQAFNWKKWQLSFIDHFSYLPQSGFGFGASTNLATPGISGSLAPVLPILQTNYQPDQSILNSTGSRYSNAFVTQLVYVVGPRVSLTFAGSFGVLRFQESGNFDSNESIFSTGLNYAISRAGYNRCPISCYGISLPRTFAVDQRPGGGAGIPTQDHRQAFLPSFCRTRDLVTSFGKKHIDYWRSQHQIRAPKEQRIVELQPRHHWRKRSA